MARLCTSAAGYCNPAAYDGCTCRLGSSSSVDGALSGHRGARMNSRQGSLLLGLVTISVTSAFVLLAKAECPQPVKIIVSYPPGSPDDVIARILAQKLS